MNEDRYRMILLAIVGVLMVMVSAIITSMPVAQAGNVEVNITNNTVFVRFQNLTVINFTTTIINLGWVNTSHLGCAYSCLYSHTPDGECKKLRVQVFDGTVLKYQADFIPSTNNTILCPDSLKGMCYGSAVFNISDFNDTAKVLITDLDTNETSGPYDFVFPYQGPTLTGYAQYIPILIPFGVLMSLAGRLSMKNVGIGLVIYGLVVPMLTVLGVEITNIMLASSISIILGAVLIWMSNQ